MLGWVSVDEALEEAILLVALTAVVLLLVRGSPALLYRSFLSRREMMAAGLLQATSLSFIVAATQIGVESNKLSSATAAGLLAGGAVSVLLFPALAVSLLRTEPAT